MQFAVELGKSWRMMRLHRLLRVGSSVVDGAIASGNHLIGSKREEVVSLPRHVKKVTILRALTMEDVTCLDRVHHFLVKYVFLRPLLGMLFEQSVSSYNSNDHGITSKLGNEPLFVPTQETDACGRAPDRVPQKYRSKKPGVRELLRMAAEWNKDHASRPVSLNIAASRIALRGSHLSDPLSQLLLPLLVCELLRRLCLLRNQSAFSCGSDRRASR